MLNVTVIEQDRWTRRALDRILSQASLAVTPLESLAEGAPTADVIVAGASSIGNRLPADTGTPFVLIVDEDGGADVSTPPNCLTVPKPIRVSVLLHTIARAVHAI